jgi:predicted TIM-barrel fold metal-dependent hydrolase
MAPDSPVFDTHTHCQPDAAPVARAGWHVGVGGVSVQTLNEVLADQGVDRCLIVTGQATGFDSSETERAAARYPSRFRVVAIVDATDPRTPARLSGWDPGGLVAGVRLVSGFPVRARGVPDEFWRAAAAGSVPVCVYAPSEINAIRSALERFPELTMVLDHAGLDLSDGVADPLHYWSDLGSLAGSSGAYVKASGLLQAAARVQDPLGSVWPAERPAVLVRRRAGDVGLQLPALVGGRVVSGISGRPARQHFRPAGAGPAAVDARHRANGVPKVVSEREGEAAKAWGPDLNLCSTRPAMVRPTWSATSICALSAAQ